ncbi:MAG TPA: hypothetical protein VFT22_08415 [Kofleriaceae bacterium]|nr:hypothetical protein [Kofleriaceae bacterium]
MKSRVFLAPRWTASSLVALALVALALVGCSGCGGDGGFPVDAPADAAARGTVSLAWGLTDLNGMPIQCDQVGASTVTLELRAHDQATGAVDSFSCANSPSTSRPLVPGIYDVSFELHGGGDTLATTLDQFGVVIQDGKDTRLDPITFIVDADGGLVLSLASPPATSNCASPATGGAGITGMTITLVHASGACEPVTFVHTKGGTTLGPYTVNCTSPAIAPCIEGDETLTVPSLPSGPYFIHVRGQVGAVDCWKNDDSIQVPPQSKSLVRTLNLALQTDTPGC